MHFICLVLESVGKVSGYQFHWLYVKCSSNASVGKICKQTAVIVVYANRNCFMYVPIWINNSQVVKSHMASHRCKSMTVSLYKKTIISRYLGDVL